MKNKKKIDLVDSQSLDAVRTLTVANALCWRLRWLCSLHRSYTPDALERSMCELTNELRLLIRTAEDQLLVVCAMRRGKHGSKYADPQERRRNG